MRKLPGGVKLYAVGTQGHLKQFPEVNIEGGASSDMPSQASKQARRKPGLASLALSLRERTVHSPGTACAPSQGELTLESDREMIRTPSPTKPETLPHAAAPSLSFSLCVCCMPPAWYLVRSRVAQATSRTK